MLFVQLADELLGVDLLTQPGIEFGDSGLDFRSQALKRLDAVEEFPAELFLCRFGKSGDLTKGNFQGLDHVQL